MTSEASAGHAAPVPGAARERRLAPGLFWLAYALLWGLAPWVFQGELARSVLGQIGVAVLVCLSFNMLLGQGGMLSFGHAIYVGLGGFVCIHALRQVAAGAWGLPVSLMPLLSALVTAGVAAGLGWFCTRRGGTTFAMITLGLGECVWALAQMLPQWLGGEAGLSANRVVGEAFWGISWGPSAQLHGLIAVYVVAGTALMHGFTLTPMGRLLNAVRDNPDRLAFLGFDPRQVRHLAVVFSAFFAGMAGALSALCFEIVTSDALSSTRSATYLVFTFIGGTAYFWGPALGAVVMVLSTVLLSEWTPAWSLYLSLFFMLVVVQAPDGLAGLGQRCWDAWRRGEFRAQGPALCRDLGSAGLLSLGLSILVEMGYHVQQNQALGPGLRHLGLLWQVDTPRDWLLALALSLLGALGLWGGRRRWRRKDL